MRLRKQATKLNVSKQSSPTIRHANVEIALTNNNFKATIAIMILCLSKLGSLISISSVIKLNKFRDRLT